MNLIHCNPKRPFISLLFPISYLLLFHAPAVTADLGFQKRNTNCAGGSYTANSKFQTNLNLLFSNLKSQSSSSNSNNSSAGTDTNRAYGLYLCEGDLAHSDCQSCIQSSTAAMTNSCPSSRQAIIWSDYCMLRYSDTNFFGFPNTSGFNMSNPNEKTSSMLPYETVSKLVQEAPLDQPLMFASTASANDQLYAMAQCTVDLNREGCQKCLTTILADIKSCCTQWRGWRYLAASCWIRYEATPFLQNLNHTDITPYKCSNDVFPLSSVGKMAPNLNNLLSNLTSKAGPTGFYNTTTGTDGGQLYGLALCRGDLVIPGNVCNNCLHRAGSAITEQCPNNTQGIEWYEECLLRYSNESFFGVVDDGGRVFCGLKNIPEAASNATVAVARKLVGEAAKNPLLFAADEAKFNNSLSSYVLVQCTRDLSSAQCNNCLQIGLRNVIGQCPQLNGWRYLSGSCTLRYEVSRFFEPVTPSGTVAPPPMSPEEDGGESLFDITYNFFAIQLNPRSDKVLCALIQFKKNVWLSGGEKKSSHTQIDAIVIPIVGVILLGPFVYYFWWWLRRRNARKRIQREAFRPNDGRELQFMDLVIIKAATNNFSEANKLGEGGFGPVYKGMLHGGREIAVKRLSAKSKQGPAEFKNEVKLIAKLQHRNLARMLGCCVEGKEKLLIYEYLPNRSLDTFLFDPEKRSQLDWGRRHLIIVGIARGLLYLHEDSLLKVIHRDLKAGNILLDNEMNPKISDFGMAKIYGADESEADTNRIVGTFGYMAPEYAMDGFFSVKSDVYSFGVLLLEILSGQKNGRSHYEQHGQTLLKHAWQLWQEGKSTELMDPLLAGSYSKDEAVKIIHIGLLCVQECTEDRPTMSLVVLMLRSEQMELPQPTQPPTFFRQRTRASDQSTASITSSTNAHSNNEVTISDLVPR